MVSLGVVTLMDLMDLGLIATALGGLGLGAMLVDYLRTRPLRTETAQLRNELARLEAQSREQTRSTVRLRNDQRSLTNLARHLPTVVRELNQSELDPRSIPGLLFQLADAIFEPAQMLLYEIGSEGEKGEPSAELLLKDQRGYRELPAGAKRIRVGEGKIGWVAEHRVEMLSEDWLNLTRTEGRNLGDNVPGLFLDLIGPMVHRDDKGDQLLGVLCIGSPASHWRDEKLMLQMVTNLASIARINARNVAKLKELANRDGLTRLLNKRFFMHRLGELMHVAERHGRPMSVFIFDIDHFKSYNDTHGHVAGDDVLRSVASVLTQSLRPGDVASRYGGEEFIVAMPDTTKEDAMTAAERIREAVASYPFAHASSQPLGRLTISGGVSALRVDSNDGTELIRFADAALYEAKSAGRNRVLPYRGVHLGDTAADDAPVDEADLPRANAGLDR